MNYNTDVQLWRNWKTFAILHGQAKIALRVIDGHICENRDVFARFNDDSAAIECLKTAGMVERDGKFYAA